MKYGQKNIKLMTDCMCLVTGNEATSLAIENLELSKERRKKY